MSEGYRGWDYTWGVRPEQGQVVDKAAPLPKGVVELAYPPVTDVTPSTEPNGGSGGGAVESALQAEQPRGWD